MYNRPDELLELLESIFLQDFSEKNTEKNTTQHTTQHTENAIKFEVIVVEDGSTISSKNICEKFLAEKKLDIHYHFQENTGQGFARNKGFSLAKGDFFIVLDSDCILPKDYLANLHQQLHLRKLDAFGGADMAHPSFTPVQKAISYAMTSIFSTGGIRGNKNSAERFRPRSFNMGVSREVWEKVGGYVITRMGEDIIYSISIEQAGFRIGFVPECPVYHKRRTNFKQFYKQLHFFGRARINVKRFYPNELKLVHCFPAVFVLFLGSILPFYWLWNDIFFVEICFLGLYISLLFSDALAKTKNLHVSFLAVYAVFVQLCGYGVGFIGEMFVSPNPAPEGGTSGGISNDKAFLQK